MIDWLSNNWQTLLGSTVIATFISSLASIWVNRKSRDKYRSELEKSSLRYQRMYDKRIDMIDELYARIVALEDLGNVFDAPNITQLKSIESGGGSTSSHTTAKDKIMEEYKKLNEYTKNNALYFTNDITKKINDFGWGNIAKAHKPEMGEYGDSEEIKNNIKRIPELKKLIESEFRKILDGDK